MLVQMKNAICFLRHLNVLRAPTNHRAIVQKWEYYTSLQSGITDEYRRLKDLNDELAQFREKRLNPAMELLKKRKKTLAEKKKMYKKDSIQYIRAETREKELKQIESR